MSKIFKQKTKPRNRVDKAIVLFDGYCNLCNSAVQFIMERDPQGKFMFASLQDVYPRKKENPSDLKNYDSVILLEKGKIYNKSSAALRIVKKLKGLWPLLYLFIIIPPAIRNGVYAYIARKRMRWFGRSEVCFAPTPENKKRFIQDPARLSLPDEIVD
ncbi:MAG: thiol-disulfide oxidoreductase DCC family protein [Bacteroidota bacterium]